jgi:putative hydroxymethylpyrimidine transport system substrate-binding protein
MRRGRYVLAGFLVALLFAGCGGSADSGGSTKTVAAPIEAPPLPSEIKVTLNEYIGAESVGLLMAEKLRYFDDAGLNVWIGNAANPKNAEYYVATRIDELGVVPLPQVPIAREDGFPIVAIGSVISRPTASMIWLEGSGIRTMADLKGKTVGISGVPFQKDLLRTVLEGAGVPPEEVEVRSVRYRLVPALQKGEVDAIFGGSPNIEGVALESRGAEPVVKPVRDLGVPAYDQLAVITREDRAAADPQAMRAFMSAVKRGTVAALRHPEMAARLIVKSPDADPKATLEETKVQLQETLPLLSMTGRLDSGQTSKFLAWMHEQGLIKQPMPASELLADQAPQP